jgi:HAMP domain-containing protein
VDTPVLVAIVAAVASIAAAFIAARSSRRATDVNEQAANLGWVKELRQDAVDARKEVSELRAEVRELRRQLEVVTAEADHWIAEHTTIRRHAFRPGMNIERLRVLFGPDPAPPARRV